MSYKCSKIAHQFKVYGLGKNQEIFPWESNFSLYQRGYKFNHLAINSTTAVAGKAGFTLASAATAVVEFMAKWLTLYPRTVTETNF